MDAIRKFKDSVDPPRTRLLRLPKIIWIFGSGPVSIDSVHRNSSFRNAFLNWSWESQFSLKEQLKIPEDFPEWNSFDGYQNLVDFERDAGSISSAILLFSEGSGALAELGVFCMDEVLSERLLVVVSQIHYKEDSFLVHGPLKKLTGDHSDASVCVIEAENPKDFYSEAEMVAEVLLAKVNDNPRRELINSNRVRDQLLLICDLVDLLGAITEKEILDVLSIFDVNLDRSKFRRMVGQLKLFGLLKEVHQYANKFFIPPVKDRDFYMDYTAIGPENFDRTRFKMVAFEQLKKEPARRKAYEQIHGEVKRGFD